MTRKASRAAHLPKGGLPILYDRAAGIDIGSRFHVVAVPPKLCEMPVRTFQGFTGNLEQMADWLVSIGIRTVAMESTGVYWVPVYEVLRDRGIDVIVANAREARMVPGRKSDVNDAQWLQRLHACGLLPPSFRPDREIAALRCYLRLRERHLDYSAAHIQHMQKALTLMNLQLHHGISDITGTTGLRIIRAIVAGQHDPSVLAAMRDVRCKSSVETVCSALSGDYQPEHLFALSQALALYDFYQAQLRECDARIELTLNSLNTRTQAPADPLPKPRHHRRLVHLLARFEGVEATVTSEFVLPISVEISRSEVGSRLGKYLAATTLASTPFLMPHAAEAQCVSPSSGNYDSGTGYSGVDFSHILSDEGGLYTSGYIPNSSSGVTIAGGLDLGTHLAV